MTRSAHRIAFGQRLRDLRQEQGWASQEAFAHHVGLDRTYVSGLERGTRNPTLDVLVKLAHGLDVKPSELLSTV
ncbi:helix-turn-helix domain-containing protein [Microbacterium sp. MMO-10]|uniref:helix-turn-helix domain-containing protein n=1 Tax=Microbacterium sp. MMO-10 TaxID=3081272 RepID=UPI0030164F8B